MGWGNKEKRELIDYQVLLTRSPRNKTKQNKNRNRAGESGFPHAER